MSCGECGRESLRLHPTFRRGKLLADFLRVLAERRYRAVVGAAVRRRRVGDRAGRRADRNPVEMRVRGEDRGANSTDPFS